MLRNILLIGCMFILTLSFTGCSSKPDIQYIDRTKKELVKPNDILLQRVKPPRMISKDAYIEGTPIERESLLQKYITRLQLSFKKANDKIRANYEFYIESQKAIDKFNKEQK